MGELTVICEEGVPHAACKISFSDGSSQWVGVQPASKVTTGWNKFGRAVDTWIDTRDRTEVAEVDLWVKLYVEDEVLREARDRTLGEYIEEEWDSSTYGEVEGGATYIPILWQDCVSFSRDLAANCGLSVGMFEPGNFSPCRLVLWLYSFNQSAVLGHNFDWTKTPADTLAGAVEASRDLSDWADSQVDWIFGEKSTPADRGRKKKRVSPDSFDPDMGGF